MEHGVLIDKQLIDDNIATLKRIKEISIKMGVMVALNMPPIIIDTQPLVDRWNKALETAITQE